MQSPWDQHPGKVVKEVELNFTLSDPMGSSKLRQLIRDVLHKTQIASATDPAWQGVAWASWLPASTAAFQERGHVLP